MEGMRQVGSGIAHDLRTPLGRLRQMLETVIDTYVPVAEDSGHTLRASIPPDVHIRGDRELLVQAVANLVENALRHTQAASRIMRSELSFMPVRAPNPLRSRACGTASPRQRA